MAVIVKNASQICRPWKIFTRYREKDITRIRSHVYGEKSKLTKGVIGYDANALYLYCSGDVMSCGKGADCEYEAI